MGLHCKTCRCATVVPRELMVKWVSDGVKAEGSRWFCETACGSCRGDSERCPRDPFCKRYVPELN